MATSKSINRTASGDGIRIDEELQKLLAPLEADELARLEASLKAEGCREPLCVWLNGGEQVLLDGHNRHRICTENGITFQTRLLKLADRQAAFAWVINNQLGRRNITPEQASYLRGLRYNAEKQAPHRPEGKGDQSDPLKTADRLAAELKVSAPTIKRDGQFAEAVDALAEIGGEDARKAILQREAKLDRKGAVKLAKLAKTDRKKAKAALAKVLGGEAKGVKQALNAEAAAAIRAEPPPLPDGRHRVIVADPPWEYENRADDASHRAANPYPSMTLDEIKAKADEVLGRAEDDCVLWLWTTNAHLRQAFEVLDAWGFTFKTVLTWAKDRMGTGDWLRGRTEHCLMAVRGRPVITLTNQTTLIEGPLREHSRKPEEFYALVESLCPGSKMEMFSRTQRPGWNQHGNEQRRFQADA